MIPNEIPAVAGAQEGLWSISDTSEFIQSQSKGAELLYFCTSQSLDGLLRGEGPGQLVSTMAGGNY